MPFSTLAVGHFVRGLFDDDTDRRTLDLDGQQVSSTFFDPLLGGDELAVAQRSLVDARAREFGGCVHVRACPSAIGWLPASRKPGEGETGSFASFAATLPSIAREPAWFPRAAYALFLTSVGLDPDKTIATIPPPDAHDSERLVRHAYLPFFPFGRLRLPAWKEIGALVLARELRPKSTELEDRALAAERARRATAVIADVAEAPPAGAVHLVEHLHLPGSPEFIALAITPKGTAWAPVGRGCWGRLDL
ncbi:MAG: hypothetical protein AAB074_13475 [Planctomycetota bacterium]